MLQASLLVRLLTRGEIWPIPVKRIQKVKVKIDLCREVPVKHR